MSMLILRVMHAHLDEENAAKRDRLAERFAGLRANKPAPVPNIREGLLDAHHFAKLLNTEAKLVRRALRTEKTIPKPSWGWYFAEADSKRVCGVVKAWLKKQAKKEAKRGK